MSGPEILEQNVGRLKTRMGAFFAGSRAVFRGHDLHADLRDMDWVELYLFGITGRRFSKERETGSASRRGASRSTSARLSIHRMPRHRRRSPRTG